MSMKEIQERRVERAIDHAVDLAILDMQNPTHKKVKAALETVERSVNLLLSSLTPLIGRDLYNHAQQYLLNKVEAKIHSTENNAA